MTNQFVALERILAAEPVNFAIWPTVQDIEGGRVSIAPAVVARIEEALARNAVILIEAPQAHRKTISALLFGYELASRGWGVSWADAEQLNCSRAGGDLADLDMPQRIVIIDDCHKNLELLDSMGPILATLRHAKVLLLSRPIPDVQLDRRATLLSKLRAEGKSLALSVDADLVRRIIADHLRSCGVEPTAEAFRAKVGDAGLKHVLQLIGGDLEVLDFVLRYWAVERETLTAISRSNLLSAVAMQRLLPNDTRQVLLRLAALYQFEIPAALAFLGDGVEKAIRDGLILDYRYRVGSTGIFCRLPHASLAGLYLEAAAHERLLDDEQNFTAAILEEYLAWRPANYHSVFRGLSFSGQRSLLVRVIMSESVRAAVQEIVLAPDRDMFRALGTLAYISREDQVFANNLAVRYFSMWRPPALRGYLSSLEDDGRKHLGKFLRLTKSIEAAWAALSDVGLVDGVSAPTDHERVVALRFLLVDMHLHARVGRKIIASLSVQLLEALFERVLDSPRLALAVAKELQIRKEPADLLAFLENVSFESVPNDRVVEHKSLHDYAELAEFIWATAAVGAHRRLVENLPLTPGDLADYLRQSTEEFLAGLRLLLVKNAENTRQQICGLLSSDAESRRLLGMGARDGAQVCEILLLTGLGAEAANYLAQVARKFDLQRAASMIVVLRAARPHLAGEVAARFPFSEFLLAGAYLRVAHFLAIGESLRDGGFINELERLLAATDEQVMRRFAAEVQKSRLLSRQLVNFVISVAEHPVLSGWAHTWVPASEPGSRSALLLLRGEDRRRLEAVLQSVQGDHD